MPVADTVFVFGGDGLLNEAVNGLGPDAVVGVLPGGRTNVVARAFGVPLDPVGAARALSSATLVRISLGRANGRRFAFAAGVGFDAELVRRVDELGRRSDGRRPGDLAFTWEAVKLLAGRRGRYEPAVVSDPRTRFTRALLLATAAVALVALVAVAAGGYRLGGSNSTHASPYAVDVILTVVIALYLIAAVGVVVVVFWSGLELRRMPRQQTKRQRTLRTVAILVGMAILVTVAANRYHWRAHPRPQNQQ